MAKKKKFSNPFDDLNPEKMDNQKLKDSIERLMSLVDDVIKNDYDGDEKKFMADMRQNIMTMEPPITSGEWEETNPMTQKSGSDKFYSRLANDLLDEFSKLNISPNLPEGVLRNSAKSIAKYLEDLITETGVWHALRSLYRKKYGKSIPFFSKEANDYYDDDINLEDLKLLVWQAFCRCGQAEGRTFSPLSPAVDTIAEVAYDILIDRFDKAPRAQRSLDTIKKVFKKADFYALRTLGIWLAADNPITASPYMREDMMESAHEALDDYLEMKIPGINLQQTYYFEEAARGWAKYMSMIGCSSADLLSEMALQLDFEDCAEKLKTVGRPIIGKFEIKSGTDRTHITFVGVDGEEYSVRKDSCGKDVEWDSIKSVFCTIVRFGDEYYQNGMASYSSEVMKNDPKDGMTMLTYIPREQLEQINELIEKNGGRRIYYCSSLEDISKVMGYKMSPQALESAGDHAFADNYLLAVSKIDGPLIYDNDCDVFKDPGNPYSEVKRATDLGDDAFNFLFHSDLPDDVIDYIVDKKLLPSACIFASQGKKAGRQIVQENLGFWFRFYRVKAYPFPCSPDDFDDNDDDDGINFEDDFYDWPQLK